MVLPTLFLSGLLVKSSTKDSRDNHSHSFLRIPIIALIRMDLVKEQMWNHDVFPNYMTALLEDMSNDISSVFSQQHPHSQHFQNQQSILRFLILNTDTPSPSCINHCIKTTQKSDLKASIFIKIIHCHCLN